MPQQVTRRAYAKVNLALAVGPPLPKDHPKAGFHPIASWMHCIDLFDDLTVTRLDDGKASTHRIRWAARASSYSEQEEPRDIDWPIEKDLAYRAHRLLEEVTGRAMPLKMQVIKRTPVGGGLGGGSSDAAGALLAIDELFGLALGRERLADLGSRLGSDVPYFVDDQGPARPALVGGLGESVHRLSPCTAGLVLIAPPFTCPTPAVYRAFDKSPTSALAADRVEAVAAGGTHAGTPDPSALFNDLTAAAIRTQPRLGEIIKTVEASTGWRVHLSGSGSCLFVVCPPAELENAAAGVKAGLLNADRQAGSQGAYWYPTVRVIPCRLL